MKEANRRPLVESEDRLTERDAVPIFQARRRGPHIAWICSEQNELVDAVAGKADISKTAADKAVEALFESITAALKWGAEVRLVGFGTFSVAARAASEGRNPRTGERIGAFRGKKFRTLRRKPTMGEMTPLRAAIILHVWRNRTDSVGVSTPERRCIGGPE
jgi:DNA-binding protein HU-beta